MRRQSCALDKQKTEHEARFTSACSRFFSASHEVSCITWLKTCTPSVECAPAEKKKRTERLYRLPGSLGCAAYLRRWPAALTSRQEGGRVVFRCCTSLTCTFAPLCKASEAGVPSSGLLCDRYSSGKAASNVCLSLSVRGHIPCQPANIMISMVRKEKKHAHSELGSPT